MNKVNILTAIAAIIICAASCGGQQPKTAAEEVKHYHWLDAGSGEIIMTRSGNVFRGEFVDFGFQERCSVPVAGTISDDGTVLGIGFDAVYGNLYAKLTGKITGDTFVAEWTPVPNAIGEHYSMTMTSQKLSPDVEAELAQHPDAFYNRLSPGTQLCSSDGMPLDRVTPFLPEKTVTDDGQIYGYQIGEWETKLMRIVSAGDDKVQCYIGIEQNGVEWLYVEMEVAAKLTGNTFRYTVKGREFEVAIYNGFAVITPTNGTTDPNAKEVAITDSEGAIDQNPDFTAAGVYPLLPMGPIDLQPYEYNLHFYLDETMTEYDNDEYDEYDEYGEYNLSDVYTMLGYLKHSGIHDGGDPMLLFDEVLMIYSHETDKLRQYGYDPEEDIIENDYVMVNESEEWINIVTNASASFTIIEYDDYHMQLVEVDRQRFLQHLADKGEMLVEITIAASGTLYEVKEVYVP
ncbi:MAG: hypothetical protein FWG84_05665 [Bacteroidales bacterium]|nr:hypothetical protein [Bacteroidales bacterium]